MERIKLKGEVFLSDREGNLVLYIPNRITRKGLEVFTRLAISDGTTVSHMELGTGSSQTQPTTERLEEPLPFTFPVISRSTQASGNAFVARFVSMIETQDPSLSFSFSEAGLMAEVPSQNNQIEKVLVARVTFPQKHKKPYNEFYLTWKIEFSLA